MKNFNELYVKNKEEKRIKTEKEHEMLAKRLSNDIKAITLSSNFLLEAESMLSEKGCLKVDHRLICRNNIIYTVTENSKCIATKFSKDTICNQLSLGSDKGQELIGDDFIKFWQDRGVHVIFVFGYMILVVDSLWEKMQNDYKTALSYGSDCKTSFFFPEARIEEMADILDASKYGKSPFCCFE